MSHPGSSKGRLPVTVPLGGAGSGSLRPRLVTGPVGIVPSLFPSLENGEAEGASRNAVVERREARRPDRKGRKDASPASSRASPARKVPYGTCVSRCSTPLIRPQVRKERGKGRIKATARPAPQIPGQRSYAIRGQTNRGQKPNDGVRSTI